MAEAGYQKPDVSRESAASEEEKPNALGLLPDDLQRILTLQLELLDKERRLERELLTEEVQAEQAFWEKRKSRWAMSPDQDYSQEEIGRARDWLKAQQDLLSQQKEALQQKLTSAQEKANAQKKTIEGWKQDLQELFKALQDLPAELKKAEQLIEQLRANLTDAEGRGFTARVEMIRQELEAAETRQTRLSSQEAQLHAAIEEGLSAWRQAREDLRQLMAGTETEDSQENLEIKIKQLDKELGFLQPYQDILIRRYLEEEEQATEPKPSHPTMQQDLHRQEEDLEA